MRKFIITNMNTGDVYEGTDLNEVYLRADRDKLEGDRITLKDVPVTPDAKRIRRIIEDINRLDPNGTWLDTDLSDRSEVIITLECAIRAYNRWATEEPDLLIKSKYYRTVFEIEDILSK